MGSRRLSIRDFVTQGSDELYSIGNTTEVRPVLDAKVAESVYPEAPPTCSSATLSDWMGTGAGFTLAAGASLEDPAFTSEYWEDTSSDC